MVNKYASSLIDFVPVSKKNHLDYLNLEVTHKQMINAISHLLKNPQKKMTETTLSNRNLIQIKGLSTLGFGGVLGISFGLILAVLFPGT